MSIRPVLLLCALVFVNTFSVGAFPVLLPEIGRAGGLDDFELGTAAAAFGLARVVADVPVGLFIAHHLRRAIVFAPCVLAVGVLCISSNGPLPVLVLGRALVGAGHAMGMVSSLTAILLHREEYTLSFSLGVFEMSGVLGILGGMAIVGVLPTTWPWQLVFLTACAPQVLGFLLLPALVASLPADTFRGSRSLLVSGPTDGESRQTRSQSAVARRMVAIGITVAIAWSAVGQFILPIRGDRQFELGRGGVAALLALPQLTDALCALPLGVIADRRGRTAVLGVILITFAVGITLLAFAPLDLVVFGCVLFGMGLAVWNLPLSILRRHTPPHRIAWRTTQYRLAVDAGIFLGPFLSGVLGEGLLWILPVICAGVSVALGVALLLHRE